MSASVWFGEPTSQRGRTPPTPPPPWHSFKFSSKEALTASQALLQPEPLPRHLWREWLGGRKGQGRAPLDPRRQHRRPAEPRPREPPQPARVRKIPSPWPSEALRNGGEGGPPDTRLATGAPAPVGGPSAPESVPPGRGGGPPPRPRAPAGIATARAAASRGNPAVLDGGGGPRGERQRQRECRGERRHGRTHFGDFCSTPLEFLSSQETRDRETLKMSKAYEFQ